MKVCTMHNDDIVGFAQYCSISFANALGYAKPTVWFWSYFSYVYTGMNINKHVLKLLKVGQHHIKHMILNDRRDQSIVSLKL